MKISFSGMKYLSTSFRLQIAFIFIIGSSCLHVCADYLIYEEEPINYSDTKPNDPVAKIINDVNNGKLFLDTTNERLFVLSFLDRLNIPVSSQVLVFSRTSFQNDRIWPQTPRAIYYSENYYIGWVQGGDLEIIAIDPQLGPIFYKMSTPFTGGSEIKLKREAQCMNCHGGSKTEGVPGMLVRSVYPNYFGQPILSAGTHLTNHSSLLNERWGGWFVTGENAGARHMGNAYFEEGKSRDATLVKDFGAPLQNLKEVFDVSRYLTDKSDIVALMVMEHQIMAHNAITKAHLNTRRWLNLDAAMAEHVGRSEGEISDAVLGYINHSAKDMVKIFLFSDEINLEGWGVEGGEDFQCDFASCSQSDRNGNSLRDFQLLSRLFKNRLSYMIHSSSFEYLHPVMKKAFYRKLWEALLGKDEDGISSHIKEKERERIVSVLLATKKDLPDYWNPGK
jgi:hypothetical protein